MAPLTGQRSSNFSSHYRTWRTPAGSPGEHNGLAPLAAYCLEGLHELHVRKLTKAYPGKTKMATYAEGLNDRTVRVWDLESGGPTLAGHNSGVEALAFSERHGRPVIVSGGLDRSARLWDLESGHASLRIEVQHWVLSVAFTADRLVIGATTELLRVDLL